MTKGLYKETDRLSKHLRQIGVNAECTEEGRIDIVQSPIGWVWLDKYCIDDKDLYTTICCVPDSRRLPNIAIKSARVRSFPLFGKTIDIRWEPIDNYGIAQALINDSIIKFSIMKLRRFVFEPSIESSGFWKKYYWKIQCGYTKEWITYPSPEYWLLCEKIAQRLVATPIAHITQEI
jgi:hypothetical protein